MKFEKIFEYASYVTTLVCVIIINWTLCRVLIIKNKHVDIFNGFSMWNLSWRHGSPFVFIIKQKSNFKSIFFIHRSVVLSYFVLFWFHHFKFDWKINKQIRTSSADGSRENFFVWSLPNQTTQNCQILHAYKILPKNKTQIGTILWGVSWIVIIRF